MKLVELAFFTDNVAEMAAFYQQLLGKEPDARSETMAIFMMGEVKIFIHQTYAPAAGELPPDNHMAFAVDDVEQTCKNLIQRGLEIEVPAKDYYWGRSAYLRDPDGQQIEIAQIANR